MSLAFLFHYLMLNMFRMLIHPSSGACDLFYGLYCSGMMRVGVTLWFGWGGVVSGCRLRHASYQSNTTHEISQQISHKLLRMDVLTSETCWALNNEIKKQVTTSWSLFIQLLKTIFLASNISHLQFLKNKEMSKLNVISIVCYRKSCAWWQL